MSPRTWSSPAAGTAGTSATSARTPSSAKGRAPAAGSGSRAAGRREGTRAVTTKRRGTGAEPPAGARECGSAAGGALAAREGQGARFVCGLPFCARRRLDRGVEERPRLHPFLSFQGFSKPLPQEAESVSSISRVRPLRERGRESERVARRQTTESRLRPLARFHLSSKSLRPTTSKVTFKERRRVRSEKKKKKKKGLRQLRSSARESHRVLSLYQRS